MIRIIVVLVKASLMVQMSGCASPASRSPVVDEVRISRTGPTFSDEALPESGRSSSTIEEEPASQKERLDRQDSMNNPHKSDKGNIGVIIGFNTDGDVAFFAESTALESVGTLSTRRVELPMPIVQQASNMRVMSFYRGKPIWFEGFDVELKLIDQTPTTCPFRDKARHAVGRGLHGC